MKRSLNYFLQKRFFWGICLGLFLLFLILRITTADEIPKIIPLDKDAELYQITKGVEIYYLVYRVPGEISRGAYIGSSVYPLEKYVGKRIRFKAMFRKTKGTAMCHKDPCSKVENVPVVDIFDIAEQ